MKKLILYFSIVCLIQTLSAQNISFNPKIGKGQGPNSNFQIDAKSIFTNNSNDSVFEWLILEINGQTGWEFGMCDPTNCLTSLIVGSKSEFTLGKGKTGEFKADFVCNNKSGTGKAKVIVYSKLNPSTITDTVEFQFNAWATAVKEVQSSREFSFFPNPAKERITIKYSTKESLSIDIYNVLGSKVKSVIHSGLETEVNISDLQNGIYFIRFKDGNQTVSKPFSKTE